VGRGMMLCTKLEEPRIPFWAVALHVVAAALPVRLERIECLTVQCTAAHSKTRLTYARRRTY